MFKSKCKELIEKVQKKYNSINPVTREVIETIVFVLVMVIVIRFFVGEIRWIPSASMRPTLIEGDRIVVERYSRFFRAPQRGDIMVFYPPFEKLKYDPIRVFSRLTGFFCKDIAYIKRVIGLPGENIKIIPDKNGKYTVFVDNEPLDEPYIKSAYDYPQCSENITCEFQIPENHYLMLGDNRGNSQDGRYWGLLSKDRIIGRAVTIFWPPRRIKGLHQK